MYTITNSVKCQTSVDISWKKQMQNILCSIGHDGLSHSIRYHIAPHCLCHPPMDTRKHIHFPKIPLQPSHNNSQLINEISLRCSCQHSVASYVFTQIQRTYKHSHFPTLPPKHSSQILSYTASTLCI